MSKVLPPPPAYEEVDRTSSNHSSNPIWDSWYRKFIALKFNQDEAIEYAKLFVENDVDTSMISELNDGVLKSIGIEKAGHRIRILRLQNNKRPQVATAAPQTDMNVPRCASHPNIVANEKCQRCNRLMCLHCRREKVGQYGTRYYCQNCYEECTIL